jgi:hypothetical protein
MEAHGQTKPEAINAEPDQPIRGQHPDTPKHVQDSVMLETQPAKQHALRNAFHSFTWLNTVIGKLKALSFFEFCCEIGLNYRYCVIACQASAGRHRGGVTSCSSHLGRQPTRS